MDAQKEVPDESIFKSETPDESTEDSATENKSDDDKSHSSARHVPVIEPEPGRAEQAGHV